MGYRVERGGRRGDKEQAYDQTSQGLAKRMIGGLCEDRTIVLRTGAANVTRVGTGGNASVSGREATRREMIRD